MITAAIPCNGHGCRYKDDCKLYEKNAQDTHGWMDSDFGWTCHEFVRKTPTIVEKDQGDLEIF